MQKQFKSISINVELITTFESKNDWRNRQQSITAGFSPREKYIWIDKNGYTLNIGEDFRIAEERGSYPVGLYRIVKQKEIKEYVGVLIKDDFLSDENIEFYHVVDRAIASENNKQVKE